RERTTDGEASPDDHDVLAPDLDAVLDEQALDAERCARPRPGHAHDESSEVHGMQAVGVLLGIDRQQRLLLVDLIRQRQLHDERIDRGIMVERVDLGLQVVPRDVGGELAVMRLDADLLAVVALGPHVGGRVGVVTDQDRAEPGRDATLDQGAHTGAQSLLRALQERVPVQQLRGHQCRKWRSPVKTMARPSSSARSMLASSRIAPPGWMTTATPAEAAASMPSGNG